MSEIEGIRLNLKSLGLGRMSEIFEDEAQRAAKLKVSYTGYLGRLAEEETLAKTERSVNARIAKARFPVLKTIEGFDFAFQPSVGEMLVRELAELAFLARAENVILVGPPGVGKTHLAIGLGIKACAARQRVLFTPAVDLLDDLVASVVSRELPDKLDALSRLDLLCVDELGYLPMDKNRANLFFQLVNRRYERGSLVITSNKAFNHWGEIFGDDVIAGAILDRLLHHSHIIAIQGKSYRIKDKKTSGIDGDQKPGYDGKID